MNIRLIIIGMLCLSIISYGRLKAQVCSARGQTPETAFPVCGTNTFAQQTVPVCSRGPIPVSCTDNAAYSDKNPFWYKFTCFTSGTLGFIITPNNLKDDYDWEVFDVTGHDPEEVYHDQSLRICSNWSGESGITGASKAGKDIDVCGGYGQALFSKMPQLIKGHNYLLLISHFTDSQSGYKLDFKGGSASITDTTPPHIATATATCDGAGIIIILNKKMKCSSLDADGSDFIMPSAAAKIISAKGNNCSSGFDMDTITLKLDHALAPGDYQVASRQGNDNNTILDACDNEIPEAEKASFSVHQLQPTPMDSIAPVGCAPQVLHLIFKTPMQCNTIAGNGSDFSISGSTPVKIISAGGNNDKGLSTVINIKLSKPLLSNGQYQISLKKGTDDNTIIDECQQETAAGATLTFKTRDTVSADFDYRIGWGCTNDSIICNNSGGNGINYWKWTFDGDNDTSNLSAPVKIYKDYGDKSVKLLVSNGVCSDSASARFNLDNQLIADFAAPEILCPEDPATFINKSSGHIISQNWTFGNGINSNLETPQPQHYPAAEDRQGRYYNITLKVKDDLGCADTAKKMMKVLNTCYIAVPTAFSPNHDGINDYLYPLNAYKADKLDFKVFNRYGQLVFETNDWTNKWDGTFKGEPQPTGSYVWILKYIDHDSGQQVFQKGTALLIR